MPYQSINRTEIDGVFKIQPKLFGDNRGWYCPELEISEFESATGITLHILQMASSYNNLPGILRGLHYQTRFPQGKLVQVSFGSVQDVAVDLRQKSPTFGNVVSVILTATEHNQLWIPPGCAHGYLALEANTRFSYLVTDGIYSPDNEKGINPFDPQLAINWLIPRDQLNLKDRDLHWPNLHDVPTEDLL